MRSRSVLLPVCGLLGCTPDTNPSPMLSEGPGSTTAIDEPTTGVPTTTAGDPLDASTTEADDESTGEPPPPPLPGLWGEYFDRYHDLVLARHEPGLDHVWGLEAPDPALGLDRFSARFRGTLTAPSTGTFTIATESDDGVRVWIDDALVIDDWNAHYLTRTEGTVDLVAGVELPILVEYFEIDIEASLRLLWSSEGLPEEVIGPDHLQAPAIDSGLPGPKPPYLNPVVPFDCPDPGVIAVEGPGGPLYSMVCTGGSFPIRQSRDLVLWQDTGAAVLPAGKPSWAANGFRNWAPELHRVNGRFMAYFTTVDADNVLCIGAATADDVLGPWVESPGPLVQHPQGVIDATYVEDEGGTPYLVYKIDGNSVGQPTPIRARQLAPDGLSFARGSMEAELLVNDPGTWEGGVVEAQWLVHHDGWWYLFYSGNVYDYRYRTGVARSASLLGPYQKHGAPILANNERWVGPGHGTVLELGGAHYFFFHAWTNAGDGTHLQEAGRHGLVDRIEWIDGWPQIHDGTPSRSWQPWPGP
ncbi:MAG: family 43 glycosylhydrolase [Myxococcales bacterium]|nr:family 43 glycosylhydrolase [Myxococcales bacterium]